jgi:hypothetical protein
VHGILAKSRAVSIDPEQLRHLAKVISRIEDQIKDEEVFASIFQSLIQNNSATAEAHAKKWATAFLARLEEKEYKGAVGGIVRGGWSNRVNGKISGHYVEIEVRETAKDRYEFVIANAGEGNPNMKAGEADAIVINRYEVKGRQEALSILTNVLLLVNDSRPRAGTNQDKAFYGLFQKAKPLEISRIPPRPLQTVGNCCMRSKQELLYYLLQRMGKEFAALANVVQSKLDEVALSRAPNPALQDAILSARKEMITALRPI